MTNVGFTPGLSLKDSSIKKKRQGVWTDKEFPEGHVIGPFKGIIIFDPDEPSDNGFSFRICDKDHLSMILLEDSLVLLPWLQAMTCACYEEKYNVVAIQNQGAFHFRTVRTLPAGTELIVQYLKVYGRDILSDSDEDIVDGGESHPKKS